MKYKINKYLLFLSLLVVGCKENPNKTKNIDFIIIEKPQLAGQYYLRSKDTILCVNPNDYMRYGINDTIKFQVDQKGFFRGHYFLRD